MEAVEVLLSELGDVESTRKLVVACLAAFAPPERRILVDTLLHYVATNEMRVQCIRILESLVQEEQQGKQHGRAARLIGAFSENPQHATGIIQLYSALPPARWCECFEVLDVESRSRLLSHLDKMTAAETQKLGQTCSSLLPLRALLYLLDNLPDKACLLCRAKRGCMRHYLLCQNMNAEPRHDKLDLRHNDDFYSFEHLESKRQKDGDKNLGEPSLLARLGLADSMHCVFYNGTCRVDTSVLCRACKDEVYSYMGKVGNDWEVFHLTGSDKLKLLKLQSQHDAARAQWWAFEAHRNQLAATLAAICESRQGEKNRARKAEQEQRVALATLRQSEKLARKREDRAFMLERCMKVDRKWQNNLKQNADRMLVKRTIYGSLQISAHDDRILHQPTVLLWKRCEVDGGGISSRKRELSENGIPLTADAASSLFGTRTLVVPDESEAIRHQKALAISRETELNDNQNMVLEHNTDMLRAQRKQDLNQWMMYSSALEDSRQRRKAGKEHAREQRRKWRKEEQAYHRRLRHELRKEGQNRAEEERRAIDDMRASKQNELAAEANQRLAMMLAETEQCAIDRFWGVPTESQRLRRLDQMERVIWTSRIALCNDVMRKTESVEPFYKDELERRQPPDLSYGDWNRIY